jgi:TonB family protein
MTLYGLRLVVALLTFCVGVTAAWLFNFGSPNSSVRKFDGGETILIERAPMPMRSCPNARPKLVIQGGTLDGKAVSKPAPVYPPAARAAGITGTVVVRVLVDESGRVTTAEATNGPEPLREAAEDAARMARFSPTLLSGAPVRVAGEVTYNFWLR